MSKKMHVEFVVEIACYLKDGNGNPIMLPNTKRKLMYLAYGVGGRTRLVSSKRSAERFNSSAAADVCSRDFWNSAWNIEKYHHRATRMVKRLPWTCT